jgi:hypothetical protein
MYRRVCHNTIYKSGIGDPDISNWIRVGLAASGYWDSTFWPWPEDSACKNNINYDWRTAETDITTQGELGYENNYNLNPSFVNTDISDPHSLTLPNLSLQANSPCINAGASLTLANGAGDNSTTLVVDDAGWFQDGTWGSALARGVTHFPDWIAIGTVGNVVEIESINYDTNTITLASPMTWANDAPIWFYKNSSGERVLYGTAPEFGAHPVVR